MAQPETYTVTIEQLLHLYLDGLSSGISTTMMNVFADVPADSRAFAQQQVSDATEDPAFTETIRDMIRVHMRGENPEPQVITTHRIDDA
jgi:hypothetical protein